MRRLTQFATSRLGAAALLGLLVLIYLWPVLISGKVLAASSSLYLFTPWYTSAPADFPQHLNSLLTDIPFAVRPWNVIMREAIHNGTFPSWNPRSLTGTPFFANPQTGMFAPFNLPLWVFSLNFGVAVSAALKMWLTGLGCYILARELKLGTWPALLAGVAFTFSSFSITWLEHQTPTAVACLLPWMIWLSERIATRRRARDALILACVCGAAIAGGHPGTAVHAVGAVALYIFVRALVDRDLARRERLQVLGLGWGGLVLGGILTAVVSLPASLAGEGTAGALARAGGGPVMPVYLLRTIAFPDWWGRSNAAEAAPVYLWNYVERTAYTGVIPVLLAFCGLIDRYDWRRKAPLVAVAALGLFVPLGVPVVRDVVIHLPLYDQVLDERMIFLFEFGVAMLAAFGLQGLIDKPREQRRYWITVIAAATVAVAAIVGSGASLHDIRTTINHFRTGTTYPFKEILSLTAVGWWLIFVTALAIALMALRTRRFPRALLGPIVILLVAVDGLHFAHGFQPMASARVATPPATPLIRYLQKHSVEGRLTGYGGALPEDYSTVFGLQDVRGYDAPQPSKNYLKLWQLANPAQVATAPFVLPNATAASERVMSVLGARWLVRDVRFTHPITGPGISLAYNGPDGEIYENRNAVPRAFVPSSVIASQSPTAAIAAISEPSFSPRHTVTVEASAGAPPPSAGPGGTVALRRETPSEVELSAHLPRRGLVVLDDANAPGWSVTVDGHPEPALNADVVMRGVAVAAGDHLIRWRYRVPGLRVGAVVSSVTLLGLLVAAFAIFRRGRRRRLAPGHEGDA